MRAGKLDTAIKIERSTHTVDEAGSPTFTWSTFASLRAEIVQSGPEEFIRAYGPSDEDVTLFRTRFIEGVGNADRLTVGGAVFNIKKVTQIRRRRGLEILAISTGQSEGGAG